MMATPRRWEPALRRAAAELKERLEKLDVAALPADAEYLRLYLEPKFRALDSALIRSRHQLSLAMDRSSDPSRLVMIDHGGGVGLTGLLAKLAGVGQVIYNDIDPKMLEMARALARAAGREADRYVLGDLDDLSRELRANRVVCGALVSYDVIEHIRDMELFFRWLGELPAPDLSVVLSSGANMFNPRYLAHVLPVQRTAEAKWRARREEIVRDLAPDLPERDVVRLARATRRCTQAEIATVIRGFRETGRISLDSVSPINRWDPWGSNTVHPDTGWWAEHLMNPWRLRRLLEQQGFRTRVMMGRYGRPPGWWKRLAASAVNAVLAVAGPVGIVVAAYYTLWAVRAPSRAGGALQGDRPGARFPAA